MKLHILTLPGDGIGPEVIREATRVLEHVATKWGHEIERSEGLLGGIAIHKTGNPFPEETRNLALEADATLLGAVGLPEFDGLPPQQRPEKGLLGLRKELDVFANLRPIVAHDSLLSSSPLKNEIVRGTDMLIVRELTAGLYFGKPRSIEEEDGERVAVNSMVYRESEIRRVARMAFSLAQERRKKVTSVDKANVLENSQLWRQIVTEVATEFPDVAVNHILVDNCAMQFVLNPTSFDVVVTENLFGDILSDEGAVLAGSIGMLPSASIGDRLANGFWRGLYEPVHGSAPDIAGQNKANPLAAIGSAAAMLNYSFGLNDEAASVNAAIGKVLIEGPFTSDLNKGGTPATTEQVGCAVCNAIG
ncbi:MAG: 3-isopropylmalate dehydrogenase [Solibacterales bacterium]|nr:3-isopropylmalate dehydrogenase [Bryobacterales bacterium]|tara:strand:+ start:4563 stop:5648 length:1086 start_codon:yes stop_codon:yes gene_type:complete